MKRILTLFSVLALTSLSACVYVQNSHLSSKGAEISTQKVSQVEPGKTSKDWVLTNFGTPDRIHADKDGLEVFEYVSERTQRSEKKFILLFSIENDKVLSRKITRIVLRDGVVESINTTDA